MEITKIKGAEVDHVQIEVAAKLHGLGYETSVLPRTSTSFEVRDISLSITLQHNDYFIRAENVGYAY